jgi:hypothetical protein
MNVAPALVLAWVVSGCAAQQSSEPEKVELPAWIAQGKQMWGSEKDGFFGVGTGEPAIASQVERQTVAENQARAAAMHEFERWYMAWLKETYNSESAEKPSMETAANSLNQAQEEVQIIERWIGPDGRTFALAHLRADFVSTLDKR